MRSAKVIKLIDTDKRCGKTLGKVVNVRKFDELGWIDEDAYFWKNDQLEFLVEENEEKLINEIEGILNHGKDLPTNTLASNIAYILMRDWQVGNFSGREHERSSSDESKSALSTQEGGSHYKGMKIQPIEYCFHNKLSYPVSNVIKYVSRYQDKNGIEDLKKAIHNIEILMEMEYGDSDGK